MSGSGGARSFPPCGYRKDIGCINCIHTRIEEWGQGKVALRCWFDGNGVRKGWVVLVYRKGEKQEQALRNHLMAPAWCKKMTAAR